MNHKPYIRELPDAENAIVFLHGIMGSPDHFARFLPRVPASWAVYNILLDGHGGTPSDFAASSMARWKSQTAELLTRLRAEHKSLYLVGHSMGSLLALDAALSDSAQIQGLFLLAVPLKIRLRPLAIRNSLKVTAGRITDTDPVALAAQRACSVAPDRRLWKYMACFPRYVELLRESRRLRSEVFRLAVPCRVWMSRKDELVSPASAKYFVSCPGVTLQWLPSSSHYYYEEADCAHYLEDFSVMCKTDPTDERRMIK